MQMIDVLKRLAELDAKNPSVIKESTEVAECGPMGMMDGIAATPSTPASLSVTAGSGEELGSMLAALMQLAGVHKVEPEHLGAEPQVSTMTSEPVMGADAERDSMRSVLDKMHDMGDEEGDEEETDEGEYDNSPADPTKPPAFEPNEFAQNTNDGDGDSSNGKRRTGMQPAATFESLMAEYKHFISESEEETDEAYNPNSVDAEHRRGLEKSHEDDLKKKADAGDESAKKRLQALKDKKERMRNDHNAAMER